MYDRGFKYFAKLFRAFYNLFDTPLRSLQRYMKVCRYLIYNYSSKRVFEELILNKDQFLLVIRFFCNTFFSPIGLKRVFRLSFIKVSENNRPSFNCFLQFNFLGPFFCFIPVRKLFLLKL